jgi:ribose-phosphate pyrophosphokinase
MSNFEFISLHVSSLINSIEKELNKKFTIFKPSSFADSEIFIKYFDINFLNNKHVIVLHQFSFEQKSISEQIIELLFLVDLVKKAGAIKVDVVLPYYPYSRQEELFGGKAKGFVFLIDKLFKASLIDEIFCFELHNSQVVKEFITKTNEISLIDFGVEFFGKNKDILFEAKDACFLSPDEGRAESIKIIAQNAGVPFAHVEKERIAKDLAVSKKLIGDVKDKNVIIIDDIIDTANTAIGACDIALKNGAKKVIGFFGHAVLSKDAVEKIEKSKFEHVFVTDTVMVGNKLVNSKKITQTSLAHILIKFLRDYYGF